MKKLFTFWRRKEDTLSSQHSDLLPSKEFKKLARAVSVGDFLKVMKYVKFKKYDVNMRDSEFRTPLHLACANGCTNIVLHLSKKKLKINLWDHETISPLTECKREICATIFLQYGADPNLVDSNGNTPLHYAACSKNISLVEKLLNYKANLEAQNEDGYTPFLLAVLKNNETMVEFLLHKGANVNASDKNQRTALMIAITNEPTTLFNLQQDKMLSCQYIDDIAAEGYASFNDLNCFEYPKPFQILPRGAKSCWNIGRGTVGISLSEKHRTAPSLIADKQAMLLRLQQWWGSALAMREPPKAPDQARGGHRHVQLGGLGFQGTKATW
ncbi:ankyrin repeat domain-containing protein 7 [Suncus etruscus]|uniref:ankyrin repeat domain-containing protein 7 n=1 Tax=Suncus etruscus TaxID=109475 RepID=UPI00210F8F04|nr:ankyrin repeat domain-containing protein 7 [Suncus etruscus]